MLLAHEHVFCRFRGGPDAALPALHKALLAARDVGVTDIVDLTPYGPVQRYASLLTDPKLPRLAGCVGFYRTRFIDQRHRTLEVRELASVMARQLARRRSVGLDVACIKVASDGHELSPLEDRVMRASVQFSLLEQDLPIVTHAIFGRHAQFRVLTESGADSAKSRCHTSQEMALRASGPRLSLWRWPGRRATARKGTLLSSQYSRFTINL